MLFLLLSFIVCSRKPRVHEKKLSERVLKPIKIQKLDFPVSKLVQLKQLRAKLGSDASYGCSMCTTVVNQMKQYINDGITDEEISEKSQVVCENFLPPYDSACDFFVEMFYSWILQQLRNGKTTNEVCVLTSLCSQY